MIKKIRIRSRGNSHVVADHPLLRGIIPSNGRITSGAAYDVPESHAMQAMDERELHRALAGCHLHVNLIRDDESESGSQTADEALQDENRALRARLAQCKTHILWLESGMRELGAKELQAGPDLDDIDAPAPARKSRRKKK